MDQSNGSLTNRRKFMQLLAMLGIGAQALLRPRDLMAAVVGANDAASELPWPKMTHRKLGRTEFEGSRLIFGCGAALARGPRDELLEAAFGAGINVFDVGFRTYYRDAELNLAPFLKGARDQVFLISKAMLPLEVEPDEQVSVEQARAAARAWLEQMDGSLGELGVDQVDAYYVMAAHNPSILASEEMYNAFLSARAAGKVRFFGLSTHQNAQRVLETAIDTGWYDLATIAVTPAGWYDWNSRDILKGTPSLTDLQPLLERARAAGIGLIGMKAGRHLAGRGWLRPGNAAAFDRFYDERLRASSLSTFQRSYAYVLAHGLDAVNADMQSLQALHENFVAAATSHTHFA